MIFHNPLNILIRSVLCVLCILFIYMIFSDFAKTNNIKVSNDRTQVITTQTNIEKSQKKVNVIPEISKFDEIIKRPLFSDDRLPFVYVAPDKTNQNKKTKTPKKPALQYRLNAVVITPEKQIAIIQSSKNKDLIRVSPGESIDEWVLINLTNHSAQLQKGDETKSLELEIKTSVKPSLSGKKNKKTTLEKQKAITESANRLKEAEIQAKTENIKTK